LPACHRPGWNGTAGRRRTGRAGAAAADGRRPPSGPDTGKSDRSTPWPSPTPPCANPTCPPPAMTRPAGSSGCWSRIASTWSPNPPRRSTGCAGTCTSSTRPGTHHPPAARPGPGSQHRQARPGHRRPRLGGPGQDLPGPGQRHPGPHRPDRQLDRQLRQRVAQPGPSRLSLPGCGPLTAAKLIAETAGVARFRSEAGLPCTPAWPRSRSAPAAPTATGGHGGQPPAECRPAPHRHHPAPPAWPRPELLPATPRPGRWDRRGPPALKRRIARAVDQRLRAALPPADIVHTTAP